MIIMIISIIIFIFLLTIINIFINLAVWAFFKYEGVNCAR